MGLVPLSRADHASLRLVGGDTVEFTETAHIATLATAEFADAAPTYPIVFADNNGRPGPCALLGLDQGRNQYLMSNGHWLPGAYVPASIRMYPFLGSGSWPNWPTADRRHSVVGGWSGEGRPGPRVADQSAGRPLRRAARALARLPQPTEHHAWSRLRARKNMPQLGA